jgi:aspartate-semialdehyde dehydrogenase
MISIGFVGWRGMVGSVLLERLCAESDLTGTNLVFYSTSQAGKASPHPKLSSEMIKDAYDVDALSHMDVILTCQGGDYTQQVHAKLRQQGWQGYWIDAASTLRLADNSVIVCGPVNQPAVTQAIAQGTKDLIGGNCTVSLLLMAIGGLLQSGLVEWVSTMTYQAQSGAGAKAIEATLQQIQLAGAKLAEPNVASLPLVQKLTYFTQELQQPAYQDNAWQNPLLTNLYPWIDVPIEKTGQTREEWKGAVEAAKILQLTSPLPIDGICVRVDALRCHAQALTIKLKQDLPLVEIESMVASSSPWTRVIPNQQAASMQYLTPVKTAGSLNIMVGRIRKMQLGTGYVSAFTVGDQLLWGAAEPLRHALLAVIAYLQE